MPQDPEWHPEGDVFVHTQLVLDRARELIDDLSYPRQVTVMLAALAHDFGKPATTKFIDGRLRSLGHEEAGVPPAESFLIASTSTRSMATTCAHRLSRWCENT